MTAHATHTTAPPATRHATAACFLTAIAGDAGAAELLELRYRLDDGQRMGQVFDAPRRLRALATRAIALGKRTDVYVGCAPRTRRHGGRDAVRRAFVLWADCDGDDAVQALELHAYDANRIVAGSYVAMRRIRRHEQVVALGDGEFLISGREDSGVALDQEDLGIRVKAQRCALTALELRHVERDRRVVATLENRNRRGVSHVVNCDHAGHGATLVELASWKPMPGLSAAEARDSRFARRMKVKLAWTVWPLLARVPLGAGGDELKRRVWDRCPAALLAA